MESLNIIVLFAAVILMISAVVFLMRAMDGNGARGDMGSMAFFAFSWFGMAALLLVFGHLQYKDVSEQNEDWMAGIDSSTLSRSIDVEEAKKIDVNAVSGMAYGNTADRLLYCLELFTGEKAAYLSVGNRWKESVSAGNCEIPLEAGST